jgi:hypothetical protein
MLIEMTCHQVNVAKPSTGIVATQRTRAPHKVG